MMIYFCFQIDYNNNILSCQRTLIKHYCWLFNVSKVNISMKLFIKYKKLCFFFNMTDTLYLITFHSLAFELCKTVMYELMGFRKTTWCLPVLVRSVTKCFCYNSFIKSHDNWRRFIELHCNKYNTVYVWMVSQYIFELHDSFVSPFIIIFFR